MRAPWIYPATAALIVLGCAKAETVAPADVVTLQACPDGGQCQPVADGASLITFAACVPDSVAAIASGLMVTLRASGGAWQNPPDKTQPSVYTAAISGSRCVSPTLVTSTGTLLLQVDAQLAGYQTSTTLPLAAAPLRSVELTALPAFLTPGQANQIALHAVVRAMGLGMPTIGTVVSFSVDAGLGAPYIAVWPPTAAIDQNGQAQSTLLLVPPATSATVSVSAAGPATPGISPAPAATASITLTSMPQDAGTDGP